LGFEPKTHRLLTTSCHQDQELTCCSLDYVITMQ